MATHPHSLHKVVSQYCRIKLGAYNNSQTVQETQRTTAGGTPIRRSADCLTSLTVSREPRRNEKSNGYFDLKAKKLCLRLNNLRSSRLSCVVLPFLTRLMYAPGKITDLIVVVKPNLLEALSYSVAGLLYYSSTTGSLLILILVKGSYLSLRVLL